MISFRPVDIVVRSPLKVGVVQGGVIEDFVEIVGQVFRAIKVSGVDKGSRRENVLVVRSSQNHRNGVQFEGIECLLRDVVSTQSVLETQVEPVVPVDEVEAGVLVERVEVTHVPVLAAGERTTVAVYVNFDEPLEQLDVSHPEDECQTDEIIIIFLYLPLKSLQWETNQTTGARDWFRVTWL